MSHTVAMPVAARPLTRSTVDHDLHFGPGQRKLLSVIAALLLFTFPIWIWALFFAGNYEYGTSLFFVPLLCLVNVLMILRITRHTHGLRKLMLVSFGMKIASAGGYMALLYVYYNKGADATVYYNVGRQWAAFFAVHGTYPITGHLWGTAFLNLCAAILVTIFGSAFPTFNVLFACAAFWGIFYFYLAFCEAFPAAPREFAALLLFLIPSVQFWNAALGKDALMILSIGMASYGFTELLSARLLKGFLIILPAATLGALTRPHVMGMAALAMLLPYTFSKGRHGGMAALARFLAIPVMVAGVVYLVRNATEMLNVDSPASGLQRIEQLGTGTMHGGSSFGVGQSTTVKLLLSPFLMFRPLPWEIPNALGVVAAIESLVLLYFLWHARARIWRFFRSWRSNAFFTYAVSFGIIFSLVFSLALSNFGLLIRQRTQFTPLLLIIIGAVHIPKAIRR
jgi:hypothetical protein